MSGSSPEADVVTMSAGTGFAGILRLSGGHVGIHAIDELLIGRPKVRSA